MKHDINENSAECLTHDPPCRKCSKCKRWVKRGDESEECLSNHSLFYDRVYEVNDPTPCGPYGWIQWKGTNVCIDLHCNCGYDGHLDCEFLYFYECPRCHARYALAQNIKLIPLTQELIALGDIEEDRFKSDVDHMKIVDGELNG